MAFGLYDAFFDVGQGGAWQLGHLTQCTRNDNVTVLKQHYSGGIAPQALFVQEAQPRIQLVTTDLYTLLTNFSISGGYHLEGTCHFPQIERANGGTFEATSNLYSLAEIMGIITSITAEGTAPAQANVDIMAISADGTTAPIQTSTGATLSAQAFVHEFSLGSAKIASTAIPGLTGVNINPGMAVLARLYNGLPYPQETFIQMVQPSITFTFEKTDLQSTVGMFAAIASTVTAYLRRRSPGGTHVANGTGSHISFTLTGGITVSDAVQASNQDAGTFSITCHGKTLATSLTATIS